MNPDLFLHLLHIVIFGTIFLYIGIRQKEAPKLIFTALLFLGIVVILYHTYKSYNKYQKHHSYWINMLHVFVIGPLLVYVGFRGTETERMYFECMIMIGFAVIGYHLYYMVLG